MYRGLTVAAVIPAYNEEGYVGDVIDGLADVIDRAYVIDDGSTDNTWEEIQIHARQKNEGYDGSFSDLVVPIRHEANRGVGAAIKTGYLHARAERIDMTAVIAGDGQMDPTVLTKFLDPIAEGYAEYTKGNRFAHPDKINTMPRFRRIGNRALSYLTKIASGYWRSMDSHNGYTVISLTALDAINIEDMYEYYGYCNELLVRLNVHEMSIADVPHSAADLYEEDWKSHIDYSGYIPRVSIMLLRSFLWRLATQLRQKKRSIVSAGYLVGIPLTITGLALSPFKEVNPFMLAFILVAGTLTILTAIVVDDFQNRSLYHPVVPAPSLEDKHIEGVQGREEGSISNRL